MMISETSYRTDKEFTEAKQINAFEEEYIATRKKEQRIYTNDEVALLPDIDPNHIHYKEWKIRKHSSERLINYLRKKKAPLKILEVGCGNGWLSAKMAEINYATITGIDLNLTELKQAFEVFDKPNLTFIYGEVHQKLMSSSFDIIVFAASVQYFPSLQQIVNTSLSLLNPQGEVHILDTHFYKDDEVKNAIKRTDDYYTALGFPAMAGHYFHHTITGLKNYNYKILSKENSFMNYLLGNNDPFPWIKIGHDK